jgi:hypothetical protein
MNNRFLISVAALALIAGTGLANAQGTMGRDAGSAGSSVQQSTGGGASTSEKGGASTMQNHESGSPSTSSGMKSTQSEQKTGGTMNRAEDSAHGQKSKSSENVTKGDRKDMKAETRDNNMKAEGREGRNGTNMNAEGRTGTSTTVGQAGAGAKLSTEQRTKITTVIRDQHIAPVTNVNFSIAVGTRVPREGVTFHPLPMEVVTIYPQWRGYEFILVRDQIVVVDPRTLQIVAVLEA